MRRRALAFALALGGACGPPLPPPSLLLVTIDTLRADRVGVYGSTAGATPNLDVFAARGVVFEEALASAPLTLPSHATILSGLEPVHHGVRDNGQYVFPGDRETLATWLKAKGYATGAFVAAYVLDRRFGLARGFDHYDDKIARRSSGASVLESERPCTAVVAAAEGWLQERSGPFLAWAHIYEPHAPYAAPEELRARFGDRAYEAEVAQADLCFGRLLKAAEARAGRRLVVAVLGDHGEGLGDHGESTHGLFVYQSTLRIPLVIAGPGLPERTRRFGLARSADVAPTLIARLGQALPAGLDGQDLFAGEAPREAYAESFYPMSFGWSPLRALRLGSLKYVDAPRPELYDLAGDPQETHDLSASRSQDVERLRAALLALVRTERAAAPRASDPEVAERLRALGYVAGSAAPAQPGLRKDPKDALPLWQEFERATEAEARGERDRAIGRLHALLAREPGNATFRRSLAAALRRAGRKAEAVRALGDLEKAAPDDAAAWHDLALVLGEAGRAEEAIRAEQRATALNPLLPEPLNHLGLLLASRGRGAEALAALDAATRLDPNNAKAWNNRGNVLRSLGRTREASQDYRRAAELDPEDADPINGLAVIAVEQGRLDEAAGALQRVLERSPRHHEARLNLAVVEAQRGNLLAARALAGAVARDASGSPVGQRAREFLAGLRP